MAVKVIITRRIKEDIGNDVFVLLNDLRFEAMKQDGYISGETLINHDNRREVIVISTWHSEKHWLKWKSDPSRQASDDEIEPYLEEPASYQIYTLGTYPH